MDGSEVHDDDGDMNDSASKEVDEDSPNALGGAAEQDVRQRAPVIRRLMGPKLPQLQPAIHSGSTPSGAQGPLAIVSSVTAEYLSACIEQHLSLHLQASAFLLLCIWANVCQGLQEDLYFSSCHKQLKGDAAPVDSM